MKSNSILIAVICGLIAAVLFLSPMTLGGMGLVMSSFTALPLFIAVLGFGTTVGIISCVVAAGMVAVFMGVLGGLSVLLATLAPAIWIGHSVGLSRNDGGENGEIGSEEWFPLSQVLFRLAIISAAIVITIGYLTAYSEQWAIDEAIAMMSQVAQMQNQAGDSSIVITPADVEARAKDVASLIPIMMPVSILLLMVLNLRLAERFARRRNWMLRPRDDLPSSVNMPPMAAGIFLVAAVIAAITTNQIGMVAQVVAGAFGGAFALVGLATIHFITRGLAARPFLLPVVYVVLLFSRFIAPVFAVLGVAECLFRVRARFAAPPKST
ncbi:MAG: DUF2232 domain-containing protein [Rhizobiaceae bacterium]|nr:DUF2232 domain-containing protein [Rhizobiaceae bacterium]